MNRSLVILLGALALGAAIFGGSYFVSHRTTEMCCAEAKDELSWLRKEFHLGGAEMARIRQLHEGYLPQCAEMCAKIAAKKRELESILGTGTNLTAEAQAKLRDLRQELFNLRLQQQGARLERPSRIRDVRRDIARAETILRERQLNHATGVMKAAPAATK